jgi:hypothetical protein
LNRTMRTTGDKLATIFLFRLDVLLESGGSLSFDVCASLSPSAPATTVGSDILFRMLETSKATRVTIEGETNAPKTLAVPAPMLYRLMAQSRCLEAQFRRYTAPGPPFRKQTRSASGLTILPLDDCWRSSYVRSGP